jgi:hypothetical protein
MTDECYSNRGALRAINRASYYALLSNIRELYEVNLVIAKVLLSLSEIYTRTPPNPDKDDDGHDEYIVHDVRDVATNSPPKTAFQNGLQRLWNVARDTRRYTCKLGLPLPSNGQK